MAEAGIRERGQFFTRQQHRGGDQVGVEPGVAGMLHQLDQILARGRLAAGEMDLQHADLGKLGQNLLPFRRRQLAARAVELERIGAIGALQRAAMRQLGEHRERNAEGLGGRLAGFEHGHAIERAVLSGQGGRRIGEYFTHEVFSRASVKNPLSARSCSMAITSVRIASRGAAYLAAS